MTLLERSERCDGTCDDGGCGDAEERDGEGDEEDREPCDLVGLGVRHDEALLDNEAAERVRRLHKDYHRHPYPQPCGHGDGGQNLHQANDDQNEVRDAIENSVASGICLGLCMGMAFGLFDGSDGVEHTDKGETPSERDE